MHLSKFSPYITFWEKVERSPLICYGMIPKGDLSQSDCSSFAFAPFLRGWFNMDVSNSTPIDEAIQQRAGLETVHY